MRTVTLLLVGLVGCGGSHVTSDEEAELAYVGLDQAVSRAMDLGLKGFSEASSANIDTQHDDGDVSGTMTVDGQADQGASANKGLRLDVVVDDYADVEDLDPSDPDDDDLFVTYDSIDPASVDLQLKSMPDGTLSGSFDGLFGMVGDLEGEVTIAVTLDGTIEDDGSGGVQRVVGDTHVVGTATNDHGGVYDIDVTL
ncbi:MAG: hypothetical protein H6734_27475 [Alphaproteobacteria bacterium]|nr:hypothetical protein [Alphaproteobacteria bacterium]MCB9688154.1 hypothetical protein [Alphaproteobacteria bacterium]